MSVRYDGHPFWPFSTVFCIFGPLSVFLSALQARAGVFRGLELSRDVSALIVNFFVSIYGTSLFLSLAGAATVIYAGVDSVRIAGRPVSPGIAAAVCAATYVVPWVLLPFLFS